MHVALGLLCAYFVALNLAQASAGDNEIKLMMEDDPEWVRTSNPVIRSPARYIWTTEPVFILYVIFVRKNGVTSCLMYM